MNLQEARTAWSTHRPQFELRGVHLEGVQFYLPDEWRHNYQLAMDAAPGSATTINAGIPSLFTTTVDPAIFETLFATLEGSEILGEVKKGSWIDDVVLFSTVERTGEVSSYGDYDENGSSGANTNFTPRQNYIFQTMKQYGQREMERAGAARLNWAAEIDKSAAWNINQFQNQSYFYGIKGLENYGYLNDPNLSAPITPSLKAFGNHAWITNGVITATANEIYNDLQALAIQLVAQSGGVIKPEKDELVLTMAPGSEVALSQANSFNVSVRDLMSKYFKRLEVVTAVQYGAKSAVNPLGNIGGNLVQLVAKKVQSQETGYAAYSDKMRTGPLIRATSSYRQKAFAGTYGAVIRQPYAFAQMLGV